MGIREFAFQPAHFQEGKGLELRPPVKCPNFRTRQVCAKCNNGWMSRLEVWAKGKIGEAVMPDFQLESMPQLVLANGDFGLMIRWLLKTAIIFELASPPGSIRAVNPELFPVAAAKEEPTDFHIWAGYIPEPNFLVHLTRGFTVWNGGVLQPYQIHSASIDFALQLNHLVFRLIRCPDATAGLKLAHVMSDGKTIIRSVPYVLPTPPRCDFPHTYLFRDFAAFLDTLEVHATPLPRLTLNSLLEFVCDQGRICPQPKIWDQLWKMLPDKHPVDGKWIPPLPLILTAWCHTSDEEKRERFHAHLRYANEHGVLGEVANYLQALEPRDWHIQI